MEEKLSSEIINILVDKHSKTVAKKKMSVKLALRNRSNVHFRW